jgi:hypothetical protein
VVETVPSARGATDGTVPSARGATDATEHPAMEWNREEFQSGCQSVDRLHLCPSCCAWPSIQTVCQLLLHSLPLQQSDTWRSVAHCAPAPQMQRAPLQEAKHRSQFRRILINVIPLVLTKLLLKYSDTVNYAIGEFKKVFVD